MTRRSRLARIEARLGIRTGPLVVCPLCHGTGVDGTAASVAVKVAEWRGIPVRDPLPPPVPCDLCHASGMSTADAADRFDRDAAAALSIIRTKLARYNATEWPDDE